MFWLGALCGFLIGVGVGVWIWYRVVEGLYDLENGPGF